VRSPQAVVWAHLRALAWAATLLAVASTSGAETLSLETYWPHRSTANWTHDRIVIEWMPAKSVQSATVRFTLGDPASVDNGYTVQPLTVDITGKAPELPALARQLAVARPEAARRALESAASAAGGSSGLVLYDAGLLRIAAEEIAAYLDAPARRSWLYLDAEITPGHTFRLQLVPDVADSVYLNGTVQGTADVSTPAGGFAAALHVRYAVDYGWANVTDSTGQVVGRSHALTRGEMFFAPGTGPVLARETFVPHWQVTGDPPPPPVDSTFAELRLIAFDVGPTSSAGTTWSALKQRYR